MCIHFLSCRWLLLFDGVFPAALFPLLTGGFEAPTSAPVGYAAPDAFAGGF